MACAMLKRCFITIALATPVSACLNGDSPLLSTELPNGYVFESNGGSYGFIRDPKGVWMGDQFGIQPDGSERWCEEFGWEADAVVCRLFDESTLLAQRSAKELGFLVLDTRTGSVWLTPDQSTATDRLRALSVTSFPKLSERHFSTKRKTINR